MGKINSSSIPNSGSPKNPIQKSNFEKILTKYYPYDIFFILYLLVISFILTDISTAGLFATDDAMYLLMAKSLADDHTLDIWNGYNELNSEELIFGSIVEHNEKLYGIYGLFYQFLSYPFYKFLGYDGLFLMNMISYLITLCILYKLSLLLFNDKMLSVSIVVTYSLFTYSIEYANELWPHSLCVCLVLLSVFLVLWEYATGRGWMPLAGFISGFAIGIRYQEVLFSMVLLFFILFWMGRVKTISFLSGFLIPVAILVTINLYMYGEITGYGHSIIRVDNMILFVVIMVFALLYALYRQSHKQGLVKPGFDKRNPALIAIILLLMVLMVLLPLLFTSDFGNALQRMETSARIIYANVVDMTSFPTTTAEKFKKALLQSDPIFILALFAPVLMYRKKNQEESIGKNIGKNFGENSGKINGKIKKEFIFILIALSVIEPLFFSAVTFHGGGGYNMRYFLEALPFLVILTSYTIRDTFKIENIDWKKKIAGAALFCSGTVFILSISLRCNLGLMHDVLKPASFFITVSLFVAFAIYYINRSRAVRVLLFGLIIIAYSYCFVATLTDIAASWEGRAESNYVAGDLMGVVENDSVVVYYKLVDLVYVAPLKLEKTVRIADASKSVKISKSLEENISGNSGDIELINFYIDTGIPVYLLGDVNARGYNTSANMSKTEMIAFIEIRDNIKNKGAMEFIRRDILPGYEYELIVADRAILFEITGLKKN